MRATVLFIFYSVAITTTYAQINEVEWVNANAPYFNVGAHQLGVKGYDLVEYFKSKRAVKGSTLNEYEYMGVTYHFSNSDNRNLFIQDPNAYLPQYGGYCAFGVGMEARSGVGDNQPGKYPINPESFKVIQGKLYLFFKSSEFDALKHWNDNESKLLKNAERQWDSMNNPR